MIDFWKRLLRSQKEQQTETFSCFFNAYIISYFFLDSYKRPWLMYDVEAKEEKKERTESEWALMSAYDIQ